MPFTTADLAQEALTELRVLAADETPSAADAQAVITRYSRILPFLELRGVASWPEASIPDPYFIPLARYIAALCAPMFGREYMDDEQALVMLRSVAIRPYQGEVTEQIDY